MKIHISYKGPDWQVSSNTHFKQYYTYFYIFFYPHIYQKHPNNIIPLSNIPIIKIRISMFKLKTIV